MGGFFLKNWIIVKNHRDIKHQSKAVDTCDTVYRFKFFYLHDRYVCGYPIAFQINVKNWYTRLQHQWGLCIYFFNVYTSVQRGLHSTLFFGALFTLLEIFTNIQRFFSYLILEYRVKKWFSKSLCMVLLKKAWARAIREIRLRYRRTSQL